MSSKTLTNIYRGRFAPSPTGPLHIGSLIAAVGSYLQAKSQNGQWLIRIEDIDPPREVKGASENIIRTLDQFGFEWDGEILYQSSRTDAYEEIIDYLKTHQHAYHCNCSRKQINETACPGINGPIYPLTCYKDRNSGKKYRPKKNQLKESRNAALRFHTPDKVIAFEDKVQGTITQNVANESGDFVVQRADGLFNYQLAVVIDDAHQKITEIVRGSDLLNLTASQISLQQALKFSSPTYLHMPIVTNAAGQKLSKQTEAKAIESKYASQALWFCLDFLGQQPPAEIRSATLTELWPWASTNWDTQKIPRLLNSAIVTDDLFPF